MSVEFYNDTTKGFCDPQGHKGDVLVYEYSFHIEVAERGVYHLIIENREYTDSNLTLLERILFEFVQDEFPVESEFETWKQSDDVVEVAKGLYREQTSQWARTFTLEQLKEYYKKEFESWKPQQEPSINTLKKNA